MADHDDDVIVVAASFLCTWNQNDPNSSSVFSYDFTATRKLKVRIRAKSPTMRV